MVDYSVSFVRALLHMIIATLVACTFTVAFASSGWWVIATMLLVPVIILSVWLLTRAADGWKKPQAPRTIIAAVAPMLTFVVIGLYSWAIGVPMGFEMWLRHDIVLAAITIPFLYIVVYGAAFVFPIMGTIIAVYYAITQRRMRECWIVCMMNLTLGFLSGGIGHLVYASTTQL